MTKRNLWRMFNERRELGEGGRMRSKKANNSKGTSMDSFTEGSTPSRRACEEDD